MNTYLKIGIAAVVASYITPTIANRLMRAELTGTDVLINAGINAAVAGGGAAAIYYALSAAMPGGGKATVAGGGGAS